MEIRAVIVSPWKVIIGELIVDVTDQYVEIKKPMAIEEILTEKGITLMPVPMSILTSTQTLKINSRHIICDAFEPPKDLVNLYIQATTGIVPAKGFFDGKR